MGSRGELLKTIETQKEQLLKYQTKLRDLIAAYKGLQKEKEALENSVKVLSAVQNQTSKSDTKPKPKAAESKAEDGSEIEGGETETTDGEDTNDAKQSASETEEAETGGNDGDQYQDQLRTLTASLATVSQEKSNMQANFQADKKKMMQEHEEKVSMLEDRLEQQATQLEQLHDKLQEWKSKLRSQQHEHEKEQDDHAIMLRELQKLLAKERDQKEQLENQLEDAKQSLVDKENAAAAHQYQQQISSLTAELRERDRKIAELEAQARLPSPMLQQLQQEMAELKAQNRISLQQEQKRANDAEDRIKAMAVKSEDRISALEAKISELSEVVGQYERLRFQDQSTMSKMRERITQLDLENTALAKAAHTMSGSDTEDGFDDKNMDVQSLVDKITHYKGLLKLANEKTDRPVDVNEILRGIACEVDAQQNYKEELDQVKEEFERYKLRAQSVLKNKSVKETSSQEVESLKLQVADLKERLRFLRLDYEEQETAHKEKEENLRKTITAIQDKHKQELIHQQAEFKTKSTELEGEIRKHRDRTISLLAEKDREIELLRRSPDKIEGHYSGQYGRSGSLGEMSPSALDMSGGGAAAASSEQDAVMSELFARTSLTGTPVGETALLHFAQEQARKDVEVGTLRRQKHSLEMALRDLQHSMVMKEEKYSSQVEDLMENVRKLERNKSRESANLEYLKNVVYHYMVCQDSLGKQQMLKAISTILEFSPKEGAEVQKALHKGWFGYGSGSGQGKH